MKRLLENYFEDNIVAKEWLSDYENLIDKLIDVQYSCSNEKINIFSSAYNNFQIFTYNILNKDCFYDAFLCYINDVIVTFDEFVDNVEIKMNYDDHTTNYEEIDRLIKSLNNIKEAYIKRPLKQSL